MKVFTASCFLLPHHSFSSGSAVCASIGSIPCPLRSAHTHSCFLNVLMYCFSKSLALKIADATDSGLGKVYIKISSALFFKLIRFDVRFTWLYLRLCRLGNLKPPQVWEPGQKIHMAKVGFSSESPFLMYWVERAARNSKLFKSSRSMGCVFFLFFYSFFFFVELVFFDKCDSSLYLFYPFWIWHNYYVHICLILSWKDAVDTQFLFCF